MSADNIAWSREDEDIEEDVNQNSVVMQITWGNFRGLFTGDIGKKVEGILIEESELKPKLTYLKAPRHGSKTSSSQEFLDHVVPELVVVSVDRENSYGHPSPEVMDRFDDMEVGVYRTDEEGNIELISDGRRVWRGR